MQQLDILLKHFDDPAIKIDFTEAHKRIKFIETHCRHFEAPFAGKPFILMLFQKAFIESIYIFYIYDNEIGRWVRKYQDVLFLVARKNGKALALDTPIPTPNGWTTMGDLKLGDYVFNEKGEPVKIIRISDVFTGHKCYKVIFEDGEVITADAEHIWTVTTKTSRRALSYKPKSNRKLLRPDYRKRNGYFNITTAEMANDFMYKRKDGGIEYKYRVPMNDAIQYGHKDLPIPPYILGVWLGDGENCRSRISVSNEELDELLSYIEQSGGKIISIKDDKTCKRVNITLKEGCLKTELKNLNLMWNKHIPDIFLQSSVEQRKELLRGLMDTDGYCSKLGQCEFVQKSKNLINDFSQLLSSLGIKHTIREKKAKCNGIDAGTVYSVLFFVDKTNSCFKLRRKHNRLKNSLANRMKNKSIIDIKEIDSVPTKCIGVDSPRNLYLAGKRMTVTHNTPLVSAICLAEFFCGPMGLKILCSSNDYEQADLMFQAINAMREESPTLEKVTRKNIKGIFFGNPKKPKKTGKFSYRNKGNIRKISAKTGAKEGRNLGMAAADEVHELKDNTSIMPIRQALSTQDEPLYFELTTEGMVNDGYLDERLKEARQVLNGELERPRWLIWLYTQDSEAEIWQDEKTWVKSNPGLGVIKKWSFLRQMVEEAKTSKSTRVFVLSKDFNIKQNNATAWLMQEDIINPETFDIEEFKNCFAIGAVDLSKSGDLACARAMFMKPGSQKKYTIRKYFIPESKLADLPKEDKDMFIQWIRDGLITVSPGNENDFSLVTAWFVKLFKDYGIRFYKIGYDKWSAIYWVKEMESYGFDCQRVEQTWGSMSEPMKLVEADLKAKLLNYGNDPIDKWCLENTALNMNSKAEIMPVKIQGKENKKIDGAVTMIIAYRIYIDNRSEFLRLVEGR
jgi:phage terminase large subunit-like protein/intein/homing endonuclease